MAFLAAKDLCNWARIAQILRFAQDDNQGITPFILLLPLHQVARMRLDHQPNLVSRLQFERIASGQG